MEITYFIRDNDKEYPEMCSRATIKLKKDNKIYYAGVQWGNIQPSNCVIYITTLLNDLLFDDWISSNGYQRIVEEIMP
jgi:hypothetical protein